MNILKALQGISAPEAKEKVDEPLPPPPPAAPKSDGYNAMASVIERHEAISNRIKNKR